MSYFNTTYWAIRTTDGALYSGGSGRINGLYSTEKRAAAHLKKFLERQKSWVQSYEQHPAGPDILAEYLDMETWRVVPVKIMETTLDGEVP